jgi:hypothetical protein
MHVRSVRLDYCPLKPLTLFNHNRPQIYELGNKEAGRKFLPASLACE